MFNKFKFAEQLQSGASMAPPPTPHKQTKPSAVKCDVLSGKKPHEIVDACTTPSWELRRHSLCSCEMGRGSLVQRELSANRLTEGLFYSRVDSPISIRQIGICLIIFNAEVDPFFHFFSNLICIQIIDIQNIHIFFSYKPFSF